VISFGGTYTKQQWSRGIRTAMIPTGWALALRLLALALAIAGVGLIVAALIQGEADVARLVRLAVPITLLAYWALQPVIRAQREDARPWSGSSAPPSLKGVVSSEGILSNSSAGGALESWDTFLRAHARDDLVVLLGADGLVTILPREFFATEDDWQGFRLMVEFNVVRPE
jgi:hypothetical protein